MTAEHYAERGLAGRNWSEGIAHTFMAPLREDLADDYAPKGARLN
jgi:hypothetical protein